MADNNDRTADKFWKGFNQKPEIEIDKPDLGKTATNLAKKVANYYGIECAPDPVGGECEGLDIKHMDAMQVIKLSLLDATAATANDGAGAALLYEPHMNEEGLLEFLQVGNVDEEKQPNDVYYEIQTAAYKEECSGVMITGKNPMAERIDKNWRSIWSGVDKEIYDTNKLNNACLAPGFSQWSTIVYDDPHLNSAYADGIDNVYEINSSNPFDSIIGYAHFMDWPGSDSDQYASVNKSDTSKILIKLDTPNLGTLKKRPPAPADWSGSSACFEGENIDESGEGGVTVPLPNHFRFASVRNTKVDKFMGIPAVYVVGKQIQILRGKPKNATAANNDSPSGEDVECFVSINQNYSEMFKLEQSKQYVAVINSGTTDSDPKIVFANNLRITDPLEIPDGGKMSFHVDPECEYAIDNEGNPVEYDEGVILPSGAKTGILVEEIWVAVELSTPSIIIYHPDGFNNRARKIAEGLTYEVMPLIVRDEPAPIALDGASINLKDSIRDHDPTTVQNLEFTALENAMKQMDGGGGMTLTLSFLNEGSIENLSASLRSYMDAGPGIETTYVCGPECDAKLCTLGQNGGIINSINYSYQDSNSYTISVNSGRHIVGGFAQADGGTALKVTEEVSCKGTIIGDCGSGTEYVVRCDGIGDRRAISMVPAVLRVGDKVSIAIHNNPVEA